MNELAIVLLIAAVIGACLAVLRELRGPVPFSTLLDRPMTWWLLAAALFAAGGLVATLA